MGLLCIQKRSKCYITTRVFWCWPVKVTNSLGLEDLKEDSPAHLSSSSQQAALLPLLYTTGPCVCLNVKRPGVCHAIN